MRTQEDGSSGTADIIWADAALMTSGKSKDGKRYSGTLLSFVNTAGKAISTVDQNKDRLFCIGLMIAEKSKCRNVQANRKVEHYLQLQGSGG